jgi:hypothetical protein
VKNTARRRYRLAEGVYIELTERQVVLIQRMTQGIGSRDALAGASTTGASYVAVYRLANYIRRVTGWKIPDATALVCRLAYLTRIVSLDHYSV